MSDLPTRLGLGVSNQSGGRSDGWYRIPQADTHKHHAKHVWIHTSAAGSRYSDPSTCSFSIPLSSPVVRYAEIMEVQRQAGIAYVHRCLGVPHGERFVLRSLRLEIMDARLLASPASAAGTVRIEQGVIQRDGERLRLAELSFAIDAASGLRAVGTAVVRIVPEHLYEKLRTRSAYSEARIADSPRAAKESRRERLTIDSADPILADHDADHVSAMAMVCAVERMVARPQRDVWLHALALTFSSFADPSPVPVVDLQCLSAGYFEGCLDQRGLPRASFRGHVDLAGGR